MLKTSVTFGSLRHLLTNLGFREIAVRKPFIGFQHDTSDVWFMFPPYQDDDLVMAHHLLPVRIQLDAWGLLAAEDFNNILGEIPTRHPAST